MVHVVEEELVRSNALRAYLVGYLMGLSWEAINCLKEDRPEAAAHLQGRLDELYPLIEKEFYAGLKKKDPVPQYEQPRT
jgi:hypothetical protein